MPYFFLPQIMYLPRAMTAYRINTAITYHQMDSRVSLLQSENAVTPVQTIAVIAGYRM